VDADLEHEGIVAAGREAPLMQINPAFLPAEVQVI
jgi:hypothetical protein